MGHALILPDPSDCLYAFSSTHSYLRSLFFIRLTLLARRLMRLIRDVALTQLTTFEPCSVETVAAIVSGVTNTPRAAEADNQRALLIAMSAEWRVALVKLADRLHNMRTLEHMPKDKQVRDGSGRCRSRRAEASGAPALPRERRGVAQMQE